MFWLKARETVFFEHYCLTGSFPILFSQIGKHGRYKQLNRISIDSNVLVLIVDRSMEGKFSLQCSLKIRSFNRAS